MAAFQIADSTATGTTTWTTTNATCSMDYLWYELPDSAVTSFIAADPLIAELEAVALTRQVRARASAENARDLRPLMRKSQVLRQHSPCAPLPRSHC